MFAGYASIAEMPDALAERGRDIFHAVHDSRDWVAGVLEWLPCLAEASVFVSAGREGGIGIAGERRAVADLVARYADAPVPPCACGGRCLERALAVGARWAELWTIADRYVTHPEITSVDMVERAVTLSRDFAWAVGRNNPVLYLGLADDTDPCPLCNREGGYCGGYGQCQYRDDDYDDDTYQITRCGRCGGEGCPHCDNTGVIYP